MMKTTLYNTRGELLLTTTNHVAKSPAGVTVYFSEERPTDSRNTAHNFYPWWRISQVEVLKG